MTISHVWYDPKRASHSTGVPMSTLADRIPEAKQNKMDRRSRGESIGNC
jgi:hypothetical protein